MIVELREGDRVRLRGPASSWVGTIVTIQEHLPYPLRIRWDGQDFAGVHLAAEVQKVTES